MLFFLFVIIPFCSACALEQQLQKSFYFPQQPQQPIVHQRLSSINNAIRFVNAAGAGKLKAIIDMLNHDIDVNSTNHIGLTALMAAALYGKIACVQYLLSIEGINLDAVLPHNGHCAVSLAVSTHHRYIVKMLLKAGARVPCYFENSAPIVNALQELEAEKKVSNWFKRLLFEI